MSGGKQRGPEQRLPRVSGKSRNSDRADAPLGKCCDDVTARNWERFDLEQSRWLMAVFDNATRAVAA
jgi:hypothetical protein